MNRPISAYWQQLLASMQAEYAQLCESSQVAPQIERALHRLREEACHFIHHIGLDLGDTGLEGPLWRAGPELLLPEISPEHKQLCYLRFRLESRYNAAINEDQQLLTMELQHLIFRLMASLRSDELMDLVGDTVAFQIVARFAYLQTAIARHADAAFWRETHAPAVVFHYRILQALVRILHSKYENTQATSSVLIVDARLAKGFHATRHLDMDAGFEILTREKFGLKISDGQLTTLMFSNEGVFLGFYAMKEAFARLGDYGIGVWLWQILPTGMLQGFRNPTADSHQPDLLYDGNRWRYLNHDLVRRKLLELEPSLGGVNARLWQVALRLSERKQGGLILVTSTAALAEICQSPEARPAPRFSVWQLLGGAPDPEPSEHRISPKQYVFEQYRNDPINEIDTEVLVSFARIDGALVVSAQGYVLGFGLILRPPNRNRLQHETGARSVAAQMASQYGLVIKISEDGPITVYYQGRRIIEN
ncbi:MAG: hypothetical protein CVV27_01200 [Candidatus Melainabacteria bacterium HGW-Melainabacteria-1]|nr:MAG: hypothetical protein CVV27_01200 [Candidatus Melainabacteria bacterium HGW-Melainabacteria-1]